MHVETYAGKVKFSFEAEKMTDVMEGLSGIHETFEDDKCGLCGHEHLRCVVRESGKYKFYEMRCTSCGGKLTFGQSDDKLYPRRYKIVKEGDDKGKALKDENGRAIRLGKQGNGWVKFNPSTGEDE